MMGNTRGDARSIIFLAVTIFAMAIIFFVINFAFTRVNTEFLANPTFANNSNAVTSINASTASADRLDWIVMAMFIGMALTIIITGWFIGGYPIFMIFYFLMMVVAVVGGMVMSNVWETMSSASVFGLTIAKFGVTNNLLTNLPVYLAVVGFLGMVAMFVKPYVNEGGGDY